MDSVKIGGISGYRIRKHAGLRCALAAFVLVIGSAQAFAQCLEERKLTASDMAGADQFGGSVAVSGDTAVVGAPGDQCPAGGESCGAAYVYGFDGTSWVEVQKLTASDAAVNDFFGFSVSVSGDTAVVGSLGHACPAGENCGAAYVFRFDGLSWFEEQELTASDAAAGDDFGWAVSVNGETAVVGAVLDDCAAGANCGSAYVFRFDGISWVEEQKLAASDGAEDDWFGVSVSMSAETVAVGAWFDDCAAGLSCGSAYVFRFDGTTWVEEEKLTASEPTARALFGSSVSVDGDTTVVGAPTSFSSESETSGSAYVFQFNGTSWVQDKKLIASDAAAGDRLGAVAISGNTIIAGASGADCAAGGDCGAAYVFSCASPVTTVGLDIKPGSCPNPLNPKSKGVVPVAVVGSFDFDVATIDPDSLTLARADGVGEDVSPIFNRSGLRIATRDVAASSGDEPCACHQSHRDGIDDLVVTFSTSEMSRALNLSGLARGETIELVLRGTLQDGSAFEAVDCIVIPGREPDGRDVACPFGADTVWSSTQLLDQVIIVGDSFQQPERYTIRASRRLDQASLTLDIAGLEELWFGTVTKLVTEVPLGERTQLYRVDNTFGTVGLVAGGFLTITTFDVQCQRDLVTWTFDYEFSLEFFPADAPPGVARVTTISGTQVGTLSEDGRQIEWSAPVGTWDRGGHVGELHLPLSDVVTPGTWSLEAGALRLDGRGAMGDRSTMPVRARVEPHRSIGRKRDRP